MDENESSGFMLELQRKGLLDHVHSEERKISCLDCLLYQIRKTSA